MFGCIFPIGDWHSVLNQRLPPACRILTIEMNHYFDIVEGSMKKRQWTCRRQPVEQMEALRRWDRAYQCLLRWTAPLQEEPIRQEESDENSSVCSCFGASSSADTNDRATTGAVTVS